MYTYINSFGDQVLCTTYDDKGNKKYNRWKIKPYAFLATSNNNTSWKSYPCNKNLSKIEFKNITSYKNEKNFYSEDMIFGALPDLPIIQTIRDKKLNKEYDLDHLDVRFFDIEVFSPDEFPKAGEANHPIVSIAMKNRKDENFIIWSLTKDFSPLQAFKNKYPQFNNCKSLEEINRIINNSKFKQLREDKLKQLKNDIKDLRKHIKDMEKFYKNINEYCQNDKNNDLILYMQRNYPNMSKEEIDDCVRRYNKKFTELDTTSFVVILDSLLDSFEKDMKRKEEELKSISKLFEQFEQYYKCIQFFHFNDESKMMRHFCEYIGSCGVDILLGWFSDSFDVPYIYNRCKKLLTKEEFNKISPYGFTTKSTYYNKKNKQEPPIDTFKIPGIIILDMVDVYMTNTYSSKASYKLNDIAQDELGLSKLDYKDEGSLADLWIKNKQKFIEYNMQDVELLYLLDKELGFIDLIVSSCYYCGISIEKYYSRTDLWTSVFYNECLDRNMVIPSKKKYPVGEKIMGGYCKAPIMGSHNWVVSFDLNSLYPSLMMEFDLSYENKLPSSLNSSNFNIIDKIINGEFDFTEWKEKNISLMPLGAQFSNKKKGLVPIIIDKLYTQRKEHKKEGIRVRKLAEKETDPIKKKNLISRSKKLLNEQHAEKILLNALYGALTYKDKRQNKAFVLYDREMAESITSMGQASIKYVEKNLNEFLNKIFKTDTDYIVAMDTDSIYVKVEAFVDKIAHKNLSDDEIVDYLDNICNNLLEPKIKEIYDNLFNMVSAYENRMSMKREVIARNAIWASKKRYVALVLDDEGVRYIEPKEKYVGVQIVRSDTPAIVKEFLKKAVRLIIEGKDYESYMEYIEKIYKTLNIEDIAISKTANKIHDYYEFKPDTIKTWGKGCPMQVRASIIHNNMLKKLGLENVVREIKSGQKIKYIHLKKMNPVDEDVIAFSDKLPEEFKLHEFIDFYEMYRKCFKKPLDDILKKNNLDITNQTMDFEIIF